MTTGRGLRERQKRRQLKKQKWACWLCDRQMAGLCCPDLAMPTWDHVIPVSRGGENKLENKLLAHKACNLARGNLMPDQGREHVLALTEKHGPLYHLTTRKLARVMKLSGVHTGGLKPGQKHGGKTLQQAQSAPCSADR